MDIDDVQRERLTWWVFVGRSGCVGHSVLEFTDVRYLWCESLATRWGSTVSISASWTVIATSHALIGVSIVLVISCTVGLLIYGNSLDVWEWFREKALRKHAATASVQLEDITYRYDGQSDDEENYFAQAQDDAEL